MTEITTQQNNDPFDYTDPGPRPVQSPAEPITPAHSPVERPHIPDDESQHTGMVILIIITQYSGPLCRGQIGVMTGYP